MMKVGMNMFVKTLALPFLVAPIFVSCMVDDPEDKFDFSSDGQPIANYQIMGKVSDEDGKPINGIRVIADYSTDVIYRADTLYTDQEGEYSKFMSIPRVDKFYMSFTDIDGQANGGEFGPNPNMSLRFAPRSQAAISAAPMSSRSTPRSKRNDVKDGGLSCFYPPSSYLRTMIRNKLDTEVQFLPGVGPKRASLLKSELGVSTVGDLLRTFPFRYIDRSTIQRIADIQSTSAYVQILAQVVSVQMTGKKLSVMVKDQSGMMELVFFRGVKYTSERLKPGSFFSVFRQA